MPRVCTVCTHAARTTIDDRLVHGVPFRTIAEQYDVSPQALIRHKNDHLPAAMIKAKEETDVRHAIDIVQQLKAINAACWQVLKEARDKRDHALVLRATDRVFKQIELQAKLIGELEQEGTTNITINAQWLSIRAVLVQALAPYPEARAAAAAALLEEQV